jgi:hypothetical protein
MNKATGIIVLSNGDRHAVSEADIKAIRDAMTHEHPFTLPVTLDGVAKIVSVQHIAHIPNLNP